jgi:uncharacterized protein
MDWVYTVSGLVVGFIVGMTGLGGGSLMTPLLILVFGVPPATAVGTDLLYASITKMSGAWVHGRNGNVDWKLVGWLAAGSLPMAAATIGVLTLLDLRDQHFAALVSGVLGVALILTAFAILFRRTLQRFSKARAHRHVEPSRVTLATIGTGAVLGLFVTVSSVGAGAIGMVALLWLYPHLPSVRLVGVDIAHAVPLTAIAGFGHFFMGTVDLVLLGSLLLGSLPGIYLGSHLAGKVPDHILRPALACMLLLVGGRLVI